MGNRSSKSKKKQYLKIGSSKYKVVSIESTNDVMTELIVSETKTKEEYLLKKMVINNGTNIDYLSEADVFSRLPSHPNIVRYVGSSHFVHQNGSIEFALLTENVSSWTNLHHLMSHQLLNDFKLKLKAFEDICHSIQHCHTNNIAHLSIHPLNILQDGFGTFKLSNFASSIIMSNGLSSMQYSRNSIFSAMHVMDNGNEHKSQLNELRKASSLHVDTHNNSIFIAPELLDPKQLTAQFDNQMFEKGDIWSLGILLLYLLYDGTVPKWYTNKLGIREADCSMFLGSTASNFVKTNMIHSSPQKRINIGAVLKFISKCTSYNDPIQFLSALNSPKRFIEIENNNFNEQERKKTIEKNHKSAEKDKKKKNLSIDSMINKVLKTNSPIFYNRLMVNFWDNNEDKEALMTMVERVYMSSSVICNRSSLTSIKLLTLLHRLFLQTPQEFMKVSIVEIKFYNQLISFWKVDSSQDGIKDLVIEYAKFMVNRLKFHNKNDLFESNFSLSQFMYNHQKNGDYANFNSGKWFDDISLSFMDLIDFGVFHCCLINSILSHKGFNHGRSMDIAVGNILNNCLIPLFEDLHSSYLITTWIIGLLRIYFGKKKTQKYSDKYKDFMISLIAVISRIQNTAKVVWNSIDIDTKQFPKSVPKIASIALLDLYPPSSFAPNLSAFNRELVNHFMDIINQQKKQIHHELPTQTHLDSHFDYDSPTATNRHFTLSLERTQTEQIKDINKQKKNEKGIKKSAHARSRSHHIPQSQMKHTPNSRTPPPRNSNKFNASSPDIFPDIDSLQITPSDLEKIFDDEQKEKQNEQKMNFDNDQIIETKQNEDEPLFFRPLSRSISSDTDRFMPQSPSNNPFMTFMISTADNALFEDEDDDVYNEDYDDEHSSMMEMDSPLMEEEKKEKEKNKNEEKKTKEKEPLQLIKDELQWKDLIIVERIGIGGFAEVYMGKIRGRNEQMDEFSDEPEEKVAIKKLINQNLTQHNLHEFNSEVQIMRCIKHPNITKFIGACTKAPHMCIVTELLEMSLFDLLHNTRLKLTEEYDFKIAFGATKGVTHLHSKQIIHRDLKSANILLDKHFEPRITDFGLSRIKDQSTLTAGTGTFQWMAPEILSGKKYDEKSDIYSLGIIFWEIKTGLLPFVSYRLNGIQASVAVVTQKKRPKIDRQLFKNKLLYSKWKDLIVRMWSQSPAPRPNGKEVLNILKEFN